jgi:hypothetical protein
LIRVFGVGRWGVRVDSYIDGINKMRHMEYSERRRQSEANLKHMEYRMGLTPKDNWEGNEDGYIKHLIGLSSCRWRDIDGERQLVDICGFEYADDHFADYDDKTSYSYNHAVGRDYLDWMLKVRTRYNELKKSGKIVDLDKAKVEQENREYWTRYYNEHPQFSRPEGY